MTRWQNAAATLLAGVALLLAIVNTVLYGQNRAVQGELAARTQYLQQSAQLEALYQEIVRALADLSARHQDRSLAEVLSRHGINVTVAPPSGQPSMPTAPAEPRGTPP